jgi:hypothetical protein
LIESNAVDLSRNRAWTKPIDFELGFVAQIDALAACVHPNVQRLMFSRNDASRCGRAMQTVL